MNGQAAKDYYRVLGVSEKADADAIRKAYRKLAKQYHPDANQGDPGASERFKEVGEAYGVLSNVEKRAQYDQMRKLGAFGLGGAGRGGGPSRSGSGPWPGGGGGPGTAGGGDASFSFDDVGGMGGIGDLFSSMFDRGGRAAGAGGRRGRGAAPAPELEVVVEIPFEKAALGGPHAIQFPVSEACGTCGGDGALPGTSVHRCVECRGTGTVSFGQGGFAVNRPCPACMGRGRVPEVPCGSCGGSGAIRQQRKLEVTIPAGIESGTRLRLSGQGEQDPASGNRGDLFVVVQVRPHRFFRRDGLDILVTLPLNLAQAVLGSTVRVRTVSGRRVVLRIPPGTQPGTRFRIRGQGIERGGRTGDQFVEVRLTLPESLNEDAKAAFTSFAEAAGLSH